MRLLFVNEPLISQILRDYWEHVEKNILKTWDGKMAQEERHLLLNLMTWVDAWVLHVSSREQALQAVLWPSPAHWSRAGILSYKCLCILYMYIWGHVSVYLKPKLGIGAIAQAVKRTGHSSRGPRFDSWHPHGHSQLSLMPFLGNLTPSYGFHGHCIHMAHRSICRKNTHHIKQK